MSSPLHIVILAAGKGKRMRSDRPKVLHEVLHRPIIHHVLELAYSVEPESVSVIVGHGEKEVRSACEEYSSVQFFTQKQQLGTADAVKTAQPFLSEQEGRVIVLCGDGILLRPETLNRLVEHHRSSESSCVVVTSECQEGGAYGRILRDGSGEISEIREFADCSPDEKRIREINSGLYSFDVKSLFGALEKVSNDNAQGEYYLPDVVKILLEENSGVTTLKLEDFCEVLGINDRVELVHSEKLLRERLNLAWMKNGVTLRAPDTTTIDPKTRLAAEVEIFGDCEIVNCQISEGVVIESGCTLRNTKVGPNTRIKRGCYLENSEVGASCALGPYAHLRPESKLEDRVKVGNFVEIKKSHLDEGAKASHLSYIGDAEVGKDVNIGCGFITCNYDGQNKHKTIIEDNVFVGSDSQMVAPVRVGQGSYVASGSTVTQDVPAESLVFSRGKQKVKVGYAKKYRK